MKKNKTILRSAAALLAGAFIGLAAQAADGGGCNANEARNDPAACKRESGAARAEGKKGNLTAPGAAADSNTADRCRALSGGEKTDCLSRVSGGGTSSTTTTSGSVEGGGEIRETTTTTVVPAKP
jgi:hypothetical protein